MINLTNRKTKKNTTTMAVRNYTDKQLLDRAKTLKGFKGIPAGYWLMGVRSAEDLPNRFDDKIYLFKGEQFVAVTSGTTNPGTTVLRSFEKFNAKGAAVLVADMWHNEIWVKGKHHGKVDALVQIGGPVSVYRDADKDDKSEASDTVQTGYFGINFHPNTYDLKAKKTGELIGGWSAGCQVINDIAKYVMILDLIPPKVKISYCLTNEFTP